MNDLNSYLRNWYCADCWVVGLKFDKYSIFHQYFSQVKFYIWLVLIAEMSLCLQVQHIAHILLYIYSLGISLLFLPFPYPPLPPPRPFLPLSFSHIHTYAVLSAAFVDNNAIRNLCRCRVCWNNSRSLNVMNGETTRIPIWCPFIFCAETIVKCSPYLPQFNVF